MILQEVNLIALAEVHSGGGAPQDADAFTQTGHPFVRAGSLIKLLEGANEDSLEKLEPTTAELNGLKLFPVGTVLFAKSGMSATKGYIYRLRNPAYVVNHLAALIPRDPRESAFLVHLLQRYSPKRLIKDPAYPSIRLGDIEEMRVSVPTETCERQQIADILDRADDLCVKRRSVLAQLDALNQSIYLYMFGDPGTNPKNWEQINLAELIISGPQNGLYKPSTDYGSGVPILRIDAFYDGVVTGLSELKRVRVSTEELNLFGLNASDIVINRVNSVEYLGKSALIPSLNEPTVFESNMMRFAVDQMKIEPRYLIEFLKSCFVKNQILKAAKRAVNQASINQQDVKKIQINLPPVELQCSYSRRVIELEKRVATNRFAMEKMDELLESLRYGAFLGEL